MFRRPRRTTLRLMFLVFALAGGGCGFNRLEAPLPDLLGGLTLEQLDLIQNDTGLTDDERRAMIREATGAPETDSGDRFVEFLLTFNVP